MPENLKIQFPSQGWRQVLTTRKAMLDQYDAGKTFAHGHEVETYHGVVAEAACRKWLTDFLPKRYGVTSGYVVSPGLKSTEPTPHFDVIIYDQLESPILWIEDHPGVSANGRSMAVPVEYVRAVLEVKATFSKRSVKKGIEHLKDLAPLMNGLDGQTDRYKLHLPPGFCCGLLFFELRSNEQYDGAGLFAMTEGIDLRGFFGGVVLRSEGHTWPHTGRIHLSASETPSASSTQSMQCPLGEYGVSDSRQLSEDAYVSGMIQWSESHFVQFAFDLQTGTLIRQVFGWDHAYAGCG